MTPEPLVICPHCAGQGEVPSEDVYGVTQCALCSGLGFMTKREYDKWATQTGCAREEKPE